MSQITTEKTGARIYVTGNTYSVKDRLKAAGCHWDGERKQWWIGAAKAEAIAEIVNGLVSQPMGAVSDSSDLGKSRVYAQVECKNRKYYVIAESHSNNRCRLTVLDGSINFWVAMGDCKLIKTYHPREVWDGRRNSGKTITRYTTLDSLREFIADRKRAEESGEVCCAECGRPGDLVADLEDGQLKHRHCCDIEP